MARVASAGSDEKGLERLNTVASGFRVFAHVLRIILLIAGVMITATFYNAEHGAHPLTPTGM
ncbi:hypothetical protein ASG35_23010 [Burkholderia sp. Leaf177]|nr:hypothetical protein ASG35_23010 [Burkholderia sp. Leaf177]